MMQIDFHSAALDFCRKHKHSAPVQDIELAMQIGASMICEETTRIIKKERLELEAAREKNIG